MQNWQVSEHKYYQQNYRQAGPFNLQINQSWVAGFSVCLAQVRSCVPVNRKHLLFNVVSTILDSYNQDRKKQQLSQEGCSGRQLIHPSFMMMAQGVLLLNSVVVGWAPVGFSHVSLPSCRWGHGSTKRIEGILLKRIFGFNWELM